LRVDIDKEVGKAATKGELIDALLFRNAQLIKWEKRLADSEAKWKQLPGDTKATAKLDREHKDAIASLEAQKQFNELFDGLLGCCKREVQSLQGQLKTAVRREDSQVWQLGNQILDRTKEDSPFAALWMEKISELVVTWLLTTEVLLLTSRNGLINPQKSKRSGLRSYVAGLRLCYPPHFKSYIC